MNPNHLRQLADAEGERLRGMSKVKPVSELWRELRERGSPGPWWNSGGIIVAADKVVIGDLDIGVNPRGTNGAATILAVNTYDALLEALEEFAALDCCTGYSLPDASWPQFWEGLDRARDALNTIREALGGDNG